jgi:PIN like domain
MGMAGLRDQFQRFYAPDPGAVAAALRTGLIVPDTNVLLNLYRFQPEARDELFGVLEQISDRLWVPYQVALEFHQNRLNVIAEQEKFFSKTKDDLEASLNEYLTKLRTFSRRIALSQSAAQRLEKGLREAHAVVAAEVSSAERANEVNLSSHDCDAVLSRLENLLSNRVGEPMSDRDLDAARKEAQRRVEAKIPPGYKDRGKSDPAGDYIIWKQLKNEAGKRKVPTVLVTDDRKEDWFRREHGLTLGPRIQLCEEMEVEAEVRFLIMTSETFLLQAKEHLSVSVSSTTVSQAKELPESLQERDHEITERYLHRKNYDDLMTRRWGIQERISDATGRLDELMVIRNFLEQVMRDSVESGLPEVGYSSRQINEIEAQMDALREEIATLQRQMVSPEDEHS